MLEMRRVGLVVALFVGMFGVSRARANLIVNPGFETPVAIRDGLGAATSGEWRGDPAEMVTAQDGIVPPEGERMVQLIASYPGSAIGYDAAIWQLIDLTPYRDQIAGGYGMVSATAQFNRVAGDNETDTSLGFFYRTNDHQPTSFGGGHVMDTFESDGDVDTWETYTSNFRLPQNTEFLFAGVLAVENVHDDWTSPEFDGHYVDDVSLTFHIIPEPPVLMLLLSGVATLACLRRLSR